MGIPTENINWAINQGFSIFCSTCSHLHESLANNSNSCGKIKCGGPLFGRDFPDYDGPLPRYLDKSICIRCGNQLISYIILLNGEHKFSICSNHVHEIENALEKININDKANDAIYIKPTIIQLGSISIDV